MGPPKGEIVSGSSHLIGKEHHVESTQIHSPMQPTIPLYGRPCNQGRLNRLGDQVPRLRKKGHCCGTSMAGGTRGGDEELWSSPFLISLIQVRSHFHFLFSLLFLHGGESGSSDERITCGGRGSKSW